MTRPAVRVRVVRSVTSFRFHYLAWETPCADGHAIYREDDDGTKWGAVGSNRDLPHDEQIARALALIYAAYPEARIGRPDGAQVWRSAPVLDALSTARGKLAAALFAFDTAVEGMTETRVVEP